MAFTRTTILDDNPNHKIWLLESVEREVIRPEKPLLFLPGGQQVSDAGETRESRKNECIEATVKNDNIIGPVAGAHVIASIDPVTKEPAVRLYLLPKDDGAKLHHQLGEYVKSKQGWEQQETFDRYVDTRNALRQQYTRENFPNDYNFEILNPEAFFASGISHLLIGDNIRALYAKIKEQVSPQLPILDSEFLKSQFAGHALKRLMPAGSDTRFMSDCLLVSEKDGERQMTLINGFKSSPLNSAKSNPIGGFFIKTDAAGETKVYLTGSYSVQDYRIMPDVMQSLGSPEDYSHVVKKTPHPAHYELWTKRYGVSAQLNRITIKLDDNLTELTEGLEYLRDKKFVSQNFMDAVLRAVRLCGSKEIGNKELQIACQQINSDIQKDLPKGKH